MSVEKGISSNLYAQRLKREQVNSLDIFCKLLYSSWKSNSSSQMHNAFVHDKYGDT